MGRLMKGIWLVNGIAWHLECMDLTREAIDNFRPPADSFQMRMHYSLYVANLMSAIDMMLETDGAVFQMALKDNLKTSKNSGDEVLGYIRELRNGIVHRGLDPTSGGLVVNGLVCAVAEPIVTNRSGVQSYSAPAHLLRDILVHCDIATRPVIKKFLEPTLAALASEQPEETFRKSLDAIDAVPHMPELAKAMARTHTSPEMLATAKAQQFAKLRRLLQIDTGCRIT